MTNNAIHLNNNPANIVDNLLENLNDKIKTINANLNANYDSYDEVLEMAKSKLNKKATADMTMDEYKEYINNKLQSLSRNATRYQDDETIIISDAGYEAMKADSDYENWVIDAVQQHLSFPNYLYGWKNSARISVQQFGATKEEYRGQMYSAHNNKSPLNNDIGDFWTQRRKRMKKMLEIEQEMFDNLYQLKELSKRKFEVQAAQAKANGLVDTSNPMQIITGVPAKFLLSMLTPTTNNV